MKIAVGAMILAAASACVLAQDVSNPVVTSAKGIFSASPVIWSLQPNRCQRTSTDIIRHRLSGHAGRSSRMSFPGELWCVRNALGRWPGHGTDSHGDDPEGRVGADSQAIVRHLPKGTGRAAGLEPGRNDHLFPRGEEAAGAALIELTDDLEDHYSQMASYLRMNGMLPPSAKK